MLISSRLGKLTLSWRRPLSYRNQSTDLLHKSMDWFLYNGLRHERVKWHSGLNAAHHAKKSISPLQNVHLKNNPWWKTCIHPPIHRSERWRNLLNSSIVTFQKSQIKIFAIVYYNCIFETSWSRLTFFFLFLSFIFLKKWWRLVIILQTGGIFLNFFKTYAI